TYSADKLGASIDVQRLAGDVRRLVAAQERGRGSDVRGEPDPADRVALGRGLAEVLHRHPHARGGGVGHVGGDEAGSDRVGGHAVRTELYAEGAHEALDAHLRGGVVGLAAVAEGGDAGETDDLAV